MVLTHVWSTYEGGLFLPRQQIPPIPPQVTLVTEAPRQPPPNTNRRSTHCLPADTFVLGCDSRASNVTQRQRTWVTGKGKYINGVTKDLGKDPRGWNVTGEVCFKQISGFPLICRFSRGDGGKAQALKIQAVWPYHTDRGQAKPEIRQQGGPGGAVDKPPCHAYAGRPGVSRAHRGRHGQPTALRRAELGDLLKTSPTPGLRR